MATKSVELNEEHDEFLDRREDINLSGLVRRELDKLMEAEDDA